MQLKSIYLAAALILFTLTSFAQKDAELTAETINAIKEKFWLIQNDRLTEIQKEKAKKELDIILQTAVNDSYKQLKDFIAHTKQEDARILAAYKPAYTHKPGEMNLYPLWEEIPGPVPSLPAAKQVNLQAKYQSYIEKVVMMKKQLGEMQEQHLGMQRSSGAEIKQDAKDMANRSAVVQQMGGADALMNMTAAQRAVAAKNIKENAMANPAVLTGLQDPGMAAMMQKMMNDPAYRDKFSKMSDAQKQAELKSFMSNTTVARDDKAFEQGLQERNKTVNAQNVQLLLGKTLTDMQEAAKPYSRGTELANAFYTGLHQSISKWYMTSYDALPLKAVGESLEKEGVTELDKFTAFLRYTLQQQEAATRTVLWSSLKTRTKIAFGEFNDFIGNFPWGKTKNASMIDGSYTEIHVANAVSSLYDEMVRITKDAASLTRIHKGWQEHFETSMK